MPSVPGLPQTRISWCSLVQGGCEFERTEACEVMQVISLCCASRRTLGQLMGGKSLRDSWPPAGSDDASSRWLHDGDSSSRPFLFMHNLHQMRDKVDMNLYRIDIAQCRGLGSRA